MLTVDLKKQGWLNARSRFLMKRFETVPKAALSHTALD